MYYYYEIYNENLAAAAVERLCCVVLKSKKGRVFYGRKQLRLPLRKVVATARVSSINCLTCSQLIGTHFSPQCTECTFDVTKIYVAAVRVTLCPLLDCDSLLSVQLISIDNRLLSVNI